MNLLILSSHGILEYDDLRLFTRLGYDVFMPGGYSNPMSPGETFRPAVPEAPHHPELVELCERQRERHAGQPTDFGIVDWAKADLHPELVEWADAIMVNCFPDAWIGGQWDAIRHKRVIWRTIGQSNPRLELEMQAFHAEGLEIVRYSPAERRAFEPLGIFAGEDAVIRFAKDPADYGPWIGDDVAVGNLTQNLDHRGDHCGLEFWQAATEGLPVRLGGTGSERLGGTGPLSYAELREYLRHLRTFLYMGTQPASYTLSLIEAMLTGVPVVSIGPGDMWLPALFEGHELVNAFAPDSSLDRNYRRAADGDLAMVRNLLDTNYLRELEMARFVGELQRQKAIELFGIDTIAEQWAAYLGARVLVPA